LPTRARISPRKSGRGTTRRYTKAELDELEKTLKEHEKWLVEWVEKQKSVPMNHDPVIETSEMRKRAKVLETQLQRLVQKKKPPRNGRRALAVVAAARRRTPQQTDEPAKSPTRRVIIVDISVGINYHNKRYWVCWYPRKSGRMHPRD
jgi:hypothetical protein